MNPQEKAVIDGIFERLRAAANLPREAEVERYIADLIRQQPYAPYVLTQSAYVQEQALLNQQSEIDDLKQQVAQLQAQPPAQQGGGFLSGLFGGGARPPEPAPMPAYGQRSVPGYPPQQPSAPPPGASPWGQQQPQAAPPRQGMGFLGTAATAVAGVAGGMVLGNVLMNAFSGGNTAHAADRPQSLASPSQGASAQESHGSESGGHGAEAYDAGYDDGGGFDNDSYEA